MTTRNRMKKIALARLKQLQKEAAPKPHPQAPGSKIRSPRSGKRKFKGKKPDFAMPAKGRRVVKHVPRGMQAVKRGRIDQAIMGGRTPVKFVPAGPKRPGLLARAAHNAADRAGGAIADRIRYGKAPKMLNVSPRMPTQGISDVASAIPGAAERAAPALKGKALSKALRYGGLGLGGLALGATGHQLAHSLGLTETGPADTLADIVVPGGKYSYDREATRQFVEGNMYVPRYFLEKAAANMATAMDDNEGTMHEGEPGMFGPEASVIPQQTLETVVPIMDHVDKSDEEADSFIQRMFANYKATKEESVGRYTKGETVVPLAKQAGRLAF